MIRRSSNEPGGLRPHAVETLFKASSSGSRHVALDLRPPRAAYHSSVKEVAIAFDETIAGINETVNNRTWEHNKESWADQYTRPYETLLYTLFEHLDYCRNILKCFVATDESFKNDPRVRAYDKSIERYRTHLGIVVNSMKHRQRRVRGIVIYDDAVSVPGYFLEMGGTMGPNNHPVILADPQIHRESNCAFSSHRDLRYHFANFYLVGRALARTVEDLVSTEDECALITDDDTDNLLFSVARRIADLPTIFYRDEVNKSIPALGASEDDAGGRTIWTEYPSNRLRPTPVKRGRITVSFMGDGMTDTFKIPYMGNGVQKH